MKLERLTRKNFCRVADKDIICYEKSESCLAELCAGFPVLDRIKKIVDNNKRSQGKFKLGERTLKVEAPSSLSEEECRGSVILITSDYYAEAFESLCKHDRVAENVDTVYYFVNRETEYELTYREAYQNTALENMILFRSGPHASSYVKGMDFADNARALFEYMLREGYNERYRLIWLVKEPDDFSLYNGMKNVEFLSFDWSVSADRIERDRYYRALCLAKYIFFTDAYGFARNCRPDQVRVQLWHGCGFKTRVNFARCEKRYEYTTVISELYSKIHQEIYGLRADQMLVTGYAKQDWLFSPAADWQSRLGVKKAQKYVFWLPTFRTAKAGLESLNEYEINGETGFLVVRTYEELARLDGLLEELGIVLVLKLHPFQKRESIILADTENIVMLDNDMLTDMDIPVNRLLAHADALISDYSSAAVDYMLLDRPIGFTLEDMEEYAASRGFVFDHIQEWLPGKELFTFDDFCSFIREVADGVDSTLDKRRKLRKIMHRFQDDHNCLRILEALHI